MSENIYAVRTNQLRSRMQQEDLRAYLIPMIFTVRNILANILKRSRGLADLQDLLPRFL